MAIEEVDMDKITEEITEATTKETKARATEETAESPSTERRVTMVVAALTATAAERPETTKKVETIEKEVAKEMMLKKSFHSMTRRWVASSRRTLILMP